MRPGYWTATGRPIGWILVFFLVNLGASSGGAAQTAVPPVGEPPRAELESTFPTTEGPNTPWIRKRHFELLEQWRDDHLEGINRTLDAYASKLDAIDHELEVRLAAGEISADEYRSTKDQLESAKKELQLEGRWHVLYREYFEKYKNDRYAWKHPQPRRHRR